MINNSLDEGTQLPYIRKALGLGYGVVVLNTNDNKPVEVSSVVTIYIVDVIVTLNQMLEVTQQLYSDWNYSLNVDVGVPLSS